MTARSDLDGPPLTDPTGSPRDTSKWGVDPDKEADVTIACWVFSALVVLVALVIAIPIIGWVVESLGAAP